MDTIKLAELDRLLSVACTMLDSAAGDIRDIPFEPRKEHIHRIGSALAEIFEIREAIWSLQPSLRPKELDEPNLEPIENRAFAHIIQDAYGFEEEGKLKEAIQRFEHFANQTTSVHLREVALSEISRLNAKLENIRKSLGA